MKIRFLFVVAFISSFGLLHAQLLDKQKQRAKERGIETREVSYDSTVYDSDAVIYEEVRAINSASDFFSKDCSVQLPEAVGCFSIKVEDPKYIATMYYTLDTPVTFSSLFGMANMKNAPKGFDPALIQVLAEESQLMEMTATNKKKSKEILR